MSASRPSVIASRAANYTVIVFTLFFILAMLLIEFLSHGDSLMLDEYCLFLKYPVHSTRAVQRASIH
jgi:hypothetical protein